MKNQMDEYKNYFGRNIGFLSQEDQDKIAGLSIGMAGAGGDGGLLSERLVRFGIGKIILADPDNFDESNINRQFASNAGTFGKNKACAVADELRLINPGLTAVVLEEGINEKNVEEFVRNSDIIIDEIEYSTPEISILLCREAKRQGKYVFMGANIGWGASVFCFSPEGISFEEYFEYDPDKKKINPYRYIGKIPEYFGDDLLPNVLDGKMAMPSLSSAVALVASFVSSEVILFFLDKKKPTVAPNFLFIDLFDLKIEKR